MNGRRVYPEADGILLLAAGEYGRDTRGVWYARPPAYKLGSIHPMMGSLEAHTVTEHEDGTITASPSIQIGYSYGDPPEQVLWHGYLEHGVWRQV